jgi:hypothetical protein
VNQSNVNITQEDAERLLREAAVRKGASLPKTVREVQIMKESEPSEEVDVPDFRRVIARIRGEKPSPDKVAEFTSPAADSEAAEELAMAARNGGDIPPEVRRRMDADRRAVEQQKE